MIDWVQLTATAFAACCGGVAAWVAIRVEVALAKLTAEDAKKAAGEAHTRLDQHIDRHHTKASV